MFTFEFLEFIKNLFMFSGYLNNNSVFPKPLSPEQEKIYIERLMKGDERAKDKLIECNLRLVAHIAKKYSNLNVDFDDLISIGTIGLIKGVSTFCPDKGNKLATYIARCVENEILMFLRAMKKSKGEVSLNDPIGVDKEGNNISLIDVLCTDDNAVIDQVQLRLQVDKLNQVLEDVLNSREKLVIELRYGLNGADMLTQREIADRLDISRSYVSRIEKKALLKLNKRLKE